MKAEFSIYYIAGLGWVLFIATLIAAIVVNEVRWGNWIRGKK